MATGLLVLYRTFDTLATFFKIFLLTEFFFKIDRISGGTEQVTQTPGLNFDGFGFIDFMF